MKNNPTVISSPTSELIRYCSGCCKVIAPDSETCPFCGKNGKTSVYAPPGEPPPKP